MDVMVGIKHMNQDTSIHPITFRRMANTLTMLSRTNKGFGFIGYKFCVFDSFGPTF